MEVWILLTLFIVLMSDAIADDGALRCMMSVSNPTTIFGTSKELQPTLNKLTLNTTIDCVEACCQTEGCSIILYHSHNSSDNNSTSEQNVNSTQPNCVMYGCHPLNTCSFMNGEFGDGVEVYVNRRDLGEADDQDKGVTTTTFSVTGSTTPASSVTSALLNDTSNVDDRANSSTVEITTTTSMMTTLPPTPTTLNGQKQTSAVTTTTTEIQQKAANVSSQNTTASDNDNSENTENVINSTLAPTATSTSSGRPQITPSFSNSSEANSSTIHTTAVSQIPRPHLPFNMTTTTSPATTMVVHSVNATQNITITQELTPSNASFVNDTNAINSTSSPASVLSTTSHQQTEHQVQSPNTTSIANTSTTNYTTTTSAPITENTSLASSNVSENNNNTKSTPSYSQNNNTSTFNNLTSYINGTLDKLPSLSSNSTYPFNSTSTHKITDPTQETINLLLVCALAFGCVFLLATVGVLGKRIYDGYRKRHYSRLDYLINGMYN